MKTIKNKMSKIITAFLVILWVPLAASAADMWAKTPDLNAGRQEHGVKIDGDYRVVNNFYSEMYAETPGLNDNLPGPQPETIENTLLANEK